jgi:biopolymer transport protein ExbD
MKRAVARRNEKDCVPELSLTSMIDVIFLLLIFFVLTANFNEIEKFLRMNLALPGQTAVTERGALPPEPGRALHIRAEPGEGGRSVWSVEGVPCVAEEEVAEKLRAYGAASTSAIIHPADSTSVEQVLEVYALCRESGLKKVQFAAKTGLKRETEKEQTQ